MQREMFTEENDDILPTDDEIMQQLLNERNLSIESVENSIAIMQKVGYNL